MGRVTLITGGVRSGKSAWALKQGESAKASARFFVATSEPLDDEMRERAQKHKLERDKTWQTVEEAYDLAGVIDKMPDNCFVIIDCCTVWLGNIWHKYGNDYMTLERHADKLLAALEQWKKQKHGEILIVSNEVGWGIVPHEESVRRYRDCAGRLNQKIAALADEVRLCVAGIPILIKQVREA